MRRHLFAGFACLLATCGIARFVGAGTVFQGGDVFTAANWNNGFPGVGNDGTIATDGTCPSVKDLGTPGPGTVIVTHSAGTLTGANDWNVHNTGDTAIFDWRQTGGNMVTAFLHPNVGVRYTLSDGGTITANGTGGSRIWPFNTGTFRQTGGTIVGMGVEIAYGTIVRLSGGTMTGCGAQIPTQALWAHGTSLAGISISGNHTISFSTAVVNPANLVLLQDGARLVFAPSWTGRWIHDNFTAADWQTALTDTGTTVGGTQVTDGNFNDLFVVGLAGLPGSNVRLKATEALTELPTVTSATLTFHLDAENMYNDGGAWNPGDGNNITDWKELTTDTSVNIQDNPSWHDAALASKPAVRFVDAENDLIHCSNVPIDSVDARTIFAVASMEADTHVYSSLVTQNGGTLCIRQDAENAAYFTGNSADFIYSGGTLVINGSARFSPPGGFGSAHVVKAVAASLKTYNSLRIGDNANNRRWSGDVAELIVYDNVLDGNDTAYVNRYLSDKYGIPQVVDMRIADTSQVADVPRKYVDLRHVGVNFYYATPTALAPALGTTAGTLHGIGFDNISLDGGSPPSGPFALTANLPATTLVLNLPFTSDNTPRAQSVGATGTDAATLNTVADEMFYLSPPAGDHATAAMTFTGLGKSHEVYVQVFGGDDGWTGDIAVTANGASVGTWLSVADNNDHTGSMFCFLTSTDASGSLELIFAGVTHYAGIGGLILTELTPPTQGTVFLLK